MSGREGGKKKPLKQPKKQSKDLDETRRSDGKTYGCKGRRGDALPSVVPVLRAVPLLAFRLRPRSLRQRWVTEKPVARRRPERPRRSGSLTN
ncbi:translation machinery-associated protein 7 [Phalacrocorax aristotelis]|uniref:translation machinery-associated protein 7 n=1 Tax=Phalacrocorax aristotelis TaxID=126867 RepID=UPI003F4BF677